VLLSEISYRIESGDMLKWILLVILIAVSPANSEEVTIVINNEDFMEYVIIPVLESLEMDSEAARRLMMGTALVESDLTHLRQHSRGPALGVYQMEKETYEDIMHRYFVGPGQNEESRLRRTVMGNYSLMRMVYDLQYATALARIRYWMETEPLPDADNIHGLASYWKKHYNTVQGDGKVYVFENKLRKYLSNIERDTRHEK
jgi:hypothetical protein